MTRVDTAGYSRVVQTYPNRSREPGHERYVHQALAQRLAHLQGIDYGGDCDPGSVTAGAVYLVPSGTVVGCAHAEQLGLRDEQDLFGGVVPWAFVATKAITHPLICADAQAPDGWSTAFAEQVRGATLDGFSVFSRADARRAAERLLARGPLRSKPVRATGGRGQQLIDSLQALEQALAELDEHELGECGLVLEENLQEVVTFSVGQVRVGGRVASYYGTQRLTPDNAGESVYGGSDLVVVAGRFEALLGLDLSPEVRQAVEQAQQYDAAASACYPGFFASRRNYDIALGIDAHGRQRSGVLEQSWRIGGASSAEIAALEAFARPGGATVVRVRSVEAFGEGAQVPSAAQVLYQGHDEDVGFITKYVLVEEHGNR
ncbi:DUF3182 family protein [Stutzerimonas azotifigens]|uniref:DUF3182 family protein n=1 Tax=Stutzerimonas azotifigens TaxID=291995 RepID=A0ABR5YWK5_9GAMM|nr:DUF3182 family protein [Stutzerimonas azotifigens]MBA1272291.1 DUF3182 family protein [Stutzerimonas azotifigens]